MQKVNEEIQKTVVEFQKIGQGNYDAMLRACSEMNKGFQAIAARWTDYSTRAFKDATRAFEQLVGAKSLEHAIEIQTNFAKTAYDNGMAELSKLGELYASAARDAYKPVEQAIAKTLPQTGSFE